MKGNEIILLHIAPQWELHGMKQLMPMQLRVM
jgi:hypothetical protein